MLRLLTLAVFFAATPALADLESSDWVRTWSPEAGGWSAGGLVAVDDAGHTYVAIGADEQLPDQTDLVIVKYDEDGSLLWEFIYDGPVHGNDAATELRLTGEGVAVVGTSPDEQGPATVLLDLDASGALRFERRVLGPDFAGFLRPQLSIGPDGRRVVASDNNNGQGVIAAFDAGGTMLFESSLSFSGFSGVSALEVLNDNRAVLVNVEAQGQNGAYVTRLFNADGDELWTRAQFAPTGLVLSDALIVATEDNDIIVAGAPEGPCTPLARVWRYDDTGDLRWVHDYNVDDCAFAIPVGLAGTSDDGVVLAADATFSSWVTRIDVNGDIVWQRILDDDVDDVQLRGLALTSAGNIAVSGLRNPQNQPVAFDIDAHLLDMADGSTLDHFLYAGPNDALDSFGSIGSGPNGAIVIGASSREDGDDGYAVTMHVDFGGPLVGDLNGDDVVDTTDLLLLLATWGACDGCPADLDGDGAVNTDDLLLLLASWTH